MKDASGNYPLLNNAVQSASGTPLFDQYNFTEKVDQTINDRNRLSASYSYNYRPRYLNNSGGNLWDASNPLLGGPLFNQNLQQIHSSLARASWDRTISPRFLNNFNVFYNRMNNPNFNQQISHNGAKEWGIANIDSAGYPSVNWGGGPIYGLSNIGNNQDDFQAYNGNGLTDTLSFSHGRHFLKAGIDIRIFSRLVTRTGGEVVSAGDY